MNRSWLPIYIVISALPSFGWAKNVELTEKFLVDQLEISSPGREKILSDYWESAVDYRRILGNFNTSLSGSAQLQHSNERNINNALPVTERVHSYSLGINRPTAFGLDLGVAYSGTKTTTNQLRDLANTRLTANVALDLYKNFLGRISRAEIKEAKLDKKAAQYLRDIEIKRLILQLRGLYWDYVAAHESFKVSNVLLKSAKEQVKDVRRRRRGEIADAGEVARFLSQESERKAQVYQFQANKKILESNFRELLPSLNGTKIKIGPYDIDATVEDFFACLDTISEQEETPFEFSLLDDIIALQEKEYIAKKKVTAAINRPSLAFVSEAGMDGKDIGFQNSHDELFDRGEEFYSVGLQLDVPLETRLSKTEKAQAELDLHRFQEEVLRVKAQMSAFHETIVEAVGLLRDVVANRLVNSKHLEKAVKDSRKKYRQARITSQQLIDEEDKFLTNQLTLIDIEVQIIKVMFDYFALFTETPCKLNRVE